jgi:hypothetical protein
MPAPRTLAHKLATVNAVRLAMTNQRLSESAACKAAGVPRACFQKWDQQLRREGEQGLNARYENCGRRPKWELNEAERNELRGKVLIHDSQAYAIEVFAREGKDCRIETRQHILDELDRAAREKCKPRWPISLRRAANVTTENKTKFRGKKAFDGVSFSPRKGLFYVDEQGREIPLLPHTAWWMDDYSTNAPYVVEGGRLCRQILVASDLATQAWLSLDTIGRERDAYRVEDILRYILRTIDGQGTMPQFLLLERGRWEDAVHGLDLGKSWEAGGLGSKFKDRLWGALDHLFTIRHGFSPRHKAGLESSIGMLQRTQAHTGTEIGRRRGEFEEATKLYLAVQQGRREARECGFLTQKESADFHWLGCQTMNQRQRHVAATGTYEVPDDLMAMFDEALRRPLPAHERWRFFPVKRRCTVRAGFIEMTVEHYGPLSFRFQINGRPEGGFLPNGYTVLAAFDPAMPDLGCHIANGEAGQLNRDALPIGQFLFTAPYARNVPLFDLRPGGFKESDKRRANAAASTDFRAINPFSKRGLRVAQKHDGRGNVTIVTTGGAMPAEPAPELRVAAAATGENEFPERVTAPGSEREDTCANQRGGVRVDLAALERAALEALDGA